MPSKISEEVKTFCYHCGEVCNTGNIHTAEKIFCCEGCKMVYKILNSEGLCEYYNLNENPGITQKMNIRQDKFAFLEDKSIEASLVSFKDENQAHVIFYIPQIHCSSCLYLLENLYKFDAGITSCKVNFTRREVYIAYLSTETSLRKIAELLTKIGYEPYISLNDLKGKRPVTDRGMIYRLGITGFCFGNIMLMSFPEYLGLDATDAVLRNLFRWFNFGLSVPVFIYAAYPIYESSYKSLRHGFLNIDAPIALAIIITFIRSAWEVLSGTGAGYFDSMTGIVFFMLAGRILQNKTYRQLSFDRDYTSYFPVAVAVIKEGKEIQTALPDIKNGNTLLLHNEELIPADGILTRGRAYIDYSFVTGESMPVLKEMGELVYAGGKQTGGNIEILVIKEVAQSYLTALWSQEEFKKPVASSISFVHLLSRYFTWIVFAIALLSALYWEIHDPYRIWVSVTAIFIIACPCALLLSNTFTNGSILHILAKNNFFLRNAQTIEAIGKVTHIVFDKTGTLTAPGQQQITYKGKELTLLQKKQLSALSAFSTHPLSKALVREFGQNTLEVIDYKEIPGQGISGIVQGKQIRIGNSRFVTGHTNDYSGTTVVYISFENVMYGFFQFSNQYRDTVPALIKDLKRRYRLSVLTGDNEAEKVALRKIAGENTIVLFNQHPEDKLAYIKHLQQMDAVVMMIGDGLNDAGALKQADIGIALSEDNNNFTPSSDAILAAGKLSKLSKFIQLCKANRLIVLASFILSITYNIIGLFFAVQGNLSPLVAAILMPSSSLCIFLVTFGCSNWLAKHLQL
jgi:Cu+-exporting ATPase